MLSHSVVSEDLFFEGGRERGKEGGSLLKEASDVADYLWRSLFGAKTVCVKYSVMPVHIVINLALLPFQS